MNNKNLLHEIGQKISNYQFGFKSKNSTVYPVTITCTNVQTNKLLGNQSAVVFLYIGKVFDSIWQKGLLYKMLGCPEFPVLSIKSFLKAAT